MSFFYFALTNPEAEPLLKAEVIFRYPELKLSYSRPGFLTFKGDKKIIFNPMMARLAGLSLGTFPSNELKFSRAWCWVRNNSLVLPDFLKDLSRNSQFNVGEEANLIMMVGPEEFWVGQYLVAPHHFRTPGEVSPIKEREVPSRAYYKINEISLAYDIPFQEGDCVLELGSAPGGASLYLLEQKLKVLGVDPAKMHPDIIANKNFKHIPRPFEVLTENSIKEEIDWIISDINLPPTVVLKEIDRLLTFLDPTGIILTLKLNQEKHLKLLYGLRDAFRKRGFEQTELKYLPSQRKEITLVAIHS